MDLTAVCCPSNINIFSACLALALAYTEVVGGRAPGARQEKKMRLSFELGALSPAPGAMPSTERMARGGAVAQQPVRSVNRTECRGLGISALGED